MNGSFTTTLAGVVVDVDFSYEKGGKLNRVYIEDVRLQEKSIIDLLGDNWISKLETEADTFIMKNEPV